MMTMAAACSHVPALKPLPALDRQQVGSRCRSVFPSGNWQVVHSIEADLYGRKSMLMGVSLLWPEKRRIHAVLMTIEGFVVFEAVFDKTVSVKRAVPPFDKKGFAHGLGQDLFLLFFSPRTDLEPETGLDEKGREICRYKGCDGKATDVLPDPAPDWQLKHYDEKGHLSRQVSAGFTGNVKTGFPKKMILSAHGPARYQLKMTLIGAEPLSP